MRTISALIGSMLAVFMVTSFVTLMQPQLYVVFRVQADNVAKRLASGLSGLRGSEAVYVGGAVVEIQADKVVVSSSGASEEEPIPKTGYQSAGGTLVVINSDGAYAWIGG